MSRIGKKPIPLPSAVKLSVRESAVELTGPKGTLSTPVPDGITCSVEGGVASLKRRDDSKSQKALHGLTRALLANAVTGVTEGFKKELDIVGVGYKAAVEGGKITLMVGLSHPAEFAIPKGITITVEKSTHIVITGADCQAVGQAAAQIRAIRKPEPYKGKGIMYTGEAIIRKAGKAAK
jgi:large subunit ribosomal protein L6